MDTVNPLSRAPSTTVKIPLSVIAVCYLFDEAQDMQSSISNLVSMQEEWNMMRDVHAMVEYNMDSRCDKSSLSTTNQEYISS